jgi:DNA-binding protein Fis
MTETAVTIRDIGLDAIVESKLANYFSTLNGTSPSQTLYEDILIEVERPLLKRVLMHVNGNKVRAAAILGINRNTLAKKLKEHKI